MLSDRARFSLESILVTPERLPGLQDLFAGRPELPPVYLASKPVMSALAGFPIHRGVLAIGQRGAEPDPCTLVPPAPAPATCLGLVGLTNHDNVGALFRNAAAFGTDAVLLDGLSCDPLYRKAIRVSAGAALTLPFVRLADGEALIAFAERQALAPIALSPGAAEEFDEAALPARVLLIVGSEGPGLPEALLSRLRGLRIGMVPGFDSLNVATAAAIVLQRLWRERTGSATAGAAPI